MGRARLWSLAAVALTVVAIAGCSEKEINPYDPQQDTTSPTVTSFVYAGGQASWSTDEEALCVLEYGPVDGDYDRYVYESTKYHSTFHQARLMGMDDGVEYKVRVRSLDRAGNEDYLSAVLPDTIVGVAYAGESMRLSMIDVGWGLSMVLTTPDGSNIIVDAGYPEHLDDVLSFLQDHGISTFEAAVVTHYHIDHYGGFEEDAGVLDSFWVGTFIAPDPTNLYRSMIMSLAEKLDDLNIDVAYVKQGDDSSNHDALAWDDTPGFRVEVLSGGIGQLVDEEDDSGTEGMNTNNDSVVLRVSFDDVSFITTGDAEHFAEYYMVDAFGREGIKADVLQIGHHGSDDSSSELWLDNVSPRVAFISCAMIEVALEKEQVLQGIRAVDADYFVTDRVFPNTPRDADPTYGHLVAITDGETIEVVLEEHEW
jgi:competence protein ComEC